MDPPPTELGITGGEPTLLGGHFITLLRHISERLPNTAVHVLTNGRLFADQSFAAEVGSIPAHDLMLGVPVYSDVDSLHDYVVQVRGAYDETLAGLYNLAAAGVAIEVRVVVHKATYERLPRLAEFIVRNLPFVQQVALMGLEVTGFARGNYNALWIDPVEYAAQLLEAVELLYIGGATVRIYNHPLCVLDRSLWQFAVPSISDWKAAYLPECEECSVRASCGGIFATSGSRHSEHIMPIHPTPGMLPSLPPAQDANPFVS
jgi:His-Xaa-Ser system radical SAM maturase HxsC